MVSRQPESPLKIVFFNRSYYPDAGSTGQLLTELAEDLVRQHGCQVSVVAGPPLVGRNGGRPRGWAVLRRESRREVEILRAWGTSFSHRTFAGRMANYLTYFFSSCIAAIAVRRANVVVSLTDPPIIGLAAWVAARWSRAKFVFLCQDVFPEAAMLLERFQNATVHRLLDLLNRFLLRKADRIVAIGGTMRERLVLEKDADRKKIAVIHNWADCSSISPSEKRNSFSLAHALADKFVVMHSGNIGLSQGLETVVQAAFHLKDFTDIQVVFVGDGVKRPVLEEQARAAGLSNVRFFPYQPKHGLRDSFASADVFVISLREGLSGYIVPSKLYGILAAGRPYVASVEEACEVSEIARKYDCGLLAEPGNPRDLADKILTLYQDRAWAKRLGDNARKAALEFDRPLAVDAYFRLLSEIKGAPTDVPL